MHLQHWKTWAMSAAVAALLGCGDDNGAAASNPGGGASGSGAAGNDVAAGSGPAAAGENLGSSGATETNAVPAACESDEGCPPGVACVLPSGGGVGFCDVSDTNVEPGGGNEAPNQGGDPITPGQGPSLGAPAPCEQDADCPDGISCKVPESGGLGFCDITEMQGG